MPFLNVNYFCNFNISLTLTSSKLTYICTQITTNKFKVMKKKLTDLMIKIVFGKIEPFKYEVRNVVEELIYTSFTIGIWIGISIVGITTLLLFYFNI